MPKNQTQLSKYLSYILRHNPQAAGLTLDCQGWANIEILLANSTEPELTREMLELLVATSDKQRFALSDDGKRIRANQGHSVAVELALPVMQPPVRLLHGTAQRFLAAILSEGLTKQQRHHVHLSESVAVARVVGSRYGKPVLLEIDSAAMQGDGFQFYRSANHVWLVESVPAKYLSILSENTLR